MKSQINFLAVLVAALVPLLMGFIWYNPKLFQKAWMKASGVTEDTMKNANMVKVFILTYIFSFLLSSVLTGAVIHQMGVFSLFVSEPNINDPASSGFKMYSEVMQLVGSKHRSFGHGLLHGVIVGVLLIFPVIGINALFEGKNFKYIAINSGFWTVCSGIMGGIICLWV